MSKNPSTAADAKFLAQAAMSLAWNYKRDLKRIIENCNTIITKDDAVSPWIINLSNDELSVRVKIRKKEKFVLREGGTYNLHEQYLSTIRQRRLRLNSIKRNVEKSIRGTSPFAY
jgi:hypothetical protein